MISAETGKRLAAGIGAAAELVGVRLEASDAISLVAEATGFPTWTVQLAVFLAGGVLGVLAMVVLGIRREERDVSLLSKPQTLIGRASRRLLSLYVRESHVDDSRRARR